ncbi:endolytic transglycosylase MltG [Sulfurihydrogenibium azorense]|uniref:endolytic transglycosylase MltG n=1 Tax=Sulfurihydrogenibium azorense TaxID=309806 RepID=UPI00240A15E6|nr:endolytic transglycosylase MltG [Sulfurihydrogenibium azorense]MDM7274472.1 endolytic transglycosylase MltG [Sulfurihydrogenibium azorense]
MKRFLFTAFTILTAFILLSLILINKKMYIDKEITIPKGSSTFEIGEILEKEGVIINKYIFIIYTKIHKDETIKAGTYQFKGNYSLKDIYEKLAKGEVKLRLFTIVPGDNLLDIAEKLEKENILKKEDFIKFVFNKENVKKYGLVGESFEGYFPPESYALDEKETVETLIAKFLELFKKRYLPYKEKIESKDYSQFYKKRITFYEAMIIASLIEKETYIPEEKPIIASVIFNRLKSNMKLDIDPTVIYALRLKNLYFGNLTKENMRIDSPFNTYKYKGLPPTPICSFSLSSLEAVLNPAKTNYFYYVLSKDRKRHIFSDNYQDHLKNVKENIKNY